MAKDMLSGHIMRPGKTAREKANGVWARHMKNQQDKREQNQALASGRKVK